MTLLSLSISHRTAPMSVVEQVSMPRGVQRELATELLTHADISEALVLSTCNRTEIHLATDTFHPALEAISGSVERLTGLDKQALATHCDVVWDEAAAVHVFNLAAGLDSLVVGESQILGQVRESLRDAQREGSLGRELNGVFQQALRVGKRVHAETAIGHAGRSVLSAALDQVEAAGVSTLGRRVLVVGAGQMAGLAARTLAGRGADLVVVNRTLSRAERLVAETGGQAASLDELDDLFGWADLVVTCVGAGSRLVTPEMLAADRRPLAICDLAMPADVDDAVRDAGVLLVNLESLAAASDAEAIQGEIEAVRMLVADEVTQHLTRTRAAAVTPTVVALRDRADEVVGAELARLQSRLDADDETIDEVRQALRRVANKLIHAPTVKVRQLATDDEATDYADALRRLFALDPDEIEASDQDHCDTHAALQVGSAVLRHPVVHP